MAEFNYLDMTPGLLSDTRINPAVPQTQAIANAQPLSQIAYSSANPQTQNLMNEGLATQNKIQKDMYNDWKGYKGSLMGQMEPYVKGFSGIASTVGSLANIYLGFQQLGLAKDSMKMAKEQWAEQKKELAHVRATRARLTASYMNG